MFMVFMFMFYVLIFMFVRAFLLLTIYYSYPTNAPIYIKIPDYITDAPKCFGASAPSWGSADVAFAQVIKC